MQRTWGYIRPFNNVSIAVISQFWAFIIPKLLKLVTKLRTVKHFQIRCAPNFEKFSSDESNDVRIWSKVISCHDVSWIISVTSIRPAPYFSSEAEKPLNDWTFQSIASIDLTSYNNMKKGTCRKGREKWLLEGSA